MSNIKRRHLCSSHYSLLENRTEWVIRFPLQHAEEEGHDSHLSILSEKQKIINWKYKYKSFNNKLSFSSQFFIETLHEWLIFLEWCYFHFYFLLLLLLLFSLCGHQFNVMWKLISDFILSTQSEHTVLESSRTPNRNHHTCVADEMEKG